MKLLQVAGRSCLAFFAGCFGSLAAATNAPVLPYRESTVVAPVEAVRYDWQDQKRDRKIPVKIYYPRTGAGPFPVIIFSHGLGGSRETYEYLGKYWASHGYVSVHLQHLGSDSAIWQGIPPAEWMQGMQKSVANLENAINRPHDVSFAIDRLTEMNTEDSPLKGRLDLKNIGVGGHSFGAFTTMAIAGQLFLDPAGREIGFADPRVKAALALSSSVPRDPRQLEIAYAKIRIPVFHMTGTLDESPLGDTNARERRVPFDRTTGVDQYLATFQGGDHMIFSGHMPLQPGGEKDPRFQELIMLGGTAFWDAYLKDDKKAKAWLADGEFAKALKEDGKFEKKGRNRRPDDRMTGAGFSIAESRGTREASIMTANLTSPLESSIGFKKWARSPLAKP